MKLDKATNLYAAFERICPLVQAKGDNMTAPTIMAGLFESIVNDMQDAYLASKSELPALDWVMEEKQKALRGAIILRHAPFITASKNSQNSYLAPAGLMPEVKGVGKQQDISEFV